MLRRRYAVLVTVLVLLMLGPGGASSQAAGFGPESGAETTLLSPFTWSDAPQFSQYRIVVRRTDTSTVIHSASIDADDPAACFDTVSCTLSAGMAGYPALETRDYEWVVFGLESSTGIWRWWGPGTWTLFHVLPDPPSPFTAVWTAAQIDLKWSGVPGAESYQADFIHDLFKPTTATFACASASCAGSENVAHIPYGTIRVKLRACGINGRCTQDGPTADVTLACPAVPSAPVIVSPVPGTSVGGLVPIQFSHTAYGERFDISIVNNVDMSTVVRESVDYETLQCTKASCVRVYPLSVGAYTASVSSSCGGASGPPATTAFTVNGSNAAPQMIAPTGGQQTSAFPLIAWRKLLNIDRYEVVLTNTATGTAMNQLVSCLTPTLCAFDTHEAGWPPITGSYTASVRVAGRTMPYATPVAFSPTFSYVPARPVILSPEDGDNTFAPTVGMTFSVDPQVPLVTAVIEGPSGFVARSPDMFRYSNACSLALEGTLSLRCRYAATLTAFGQHRATAIAWTFTDASGSRSDLTTQNLFLRPPTLVFASPKASYSIYAQNMQFLPPTPLSEGASSAYGHTDTSRADKLADYIFEHNFDVVALSEVFTPEAKVALNRRLAPSYFGVSNIDTEGHVETIGWVAFAAAYLGNWWMGAAPAIAINVASIKMLEDLIRSSNSGLAVYTKMPILTHPGKGGSDNSRCTSDLFNAVSEYRPDHEDPTIPVKDLVWFRQYCRGVGIDWLSAKGIAAVELQNPYTGHPLLLAWSHTQAYTGSSSFDRWSGDYAPSYKARADQVENNGTHVIENFVKQYRATSQPFDAFILGDWNIPSPPSVSDVPQLALDSNNDVIGHTDGWANYSLMYTGPPVTGDPRNPTLDSLVGSHSPGGGTTLFDQYWKYFDVRNPGRRFPGFSDLWLQNPAGDPGFTFSPTENSVAKCHEVGEPCHGTAELDRGARYDTVLARFHALSMDGRHVDGGYPPPSNPLRTGHPAWIQNISCVQHVRRAKDFGLSDHFGTIIEVGPDAPFCSPNKAKPDPHLWREPKNAPRPMRPKDETFDDAAGVHRGTFSYGGANEWFYFSEHGGFDFIPLSKDPSIPQLRIDAYDARDLSTMILVADAEQKTNQSLAGTCPGARESIRANGYIPEECATGEQRITYVNPKPFFVRIRPADETGRICDTCMGNYEILIRKRTCKVPHEHILAAEGESKATNQGWFGEGQRHCWFGYQLAKETLPTDHQQLTVADLYRANNDLCQARGGIGICSNRYEALFFDASPSPDNVSAPPKPTVEIHPAETFVAGGGDRRLLTDESWFEKGTRMPEGVVQETGRRKFYARVERDDVSRPHESAFPWNSDLKMATYNAITVSDIQDDLELEIEICVPLLGCIIDEPKDPFETEDEILVELWANTISLPGFEVKHANIGHSGAKAMSYPNAAPGGLPPGCAAYQRCFQPGTEDKYKGTTVNYTQFTNTRVLERDGVSASDVVVGDEVMCGASGPPPAFGIQGSFFRNRWEEVKKGAPDSSQTWIFSDDCPDDDPDFRYHLRVVVPQKP